MHFLPQIFLVWLFLEGAVFFEKLGRNYFWGMIIFKIMGGGGGLWTVYRERFTTLIKELYFLTNEDIDEDIDGTVEYNNVNNGVR